MGATSINLTRLGASQKRGTTTLISSDTIVLATTNYVRVQSSVVGTAVTATIDTTGATVGDVLVFHLLDNLSLASGDLIVQVASGGLLADGRGNSVFSRRIYGSFGIRTLVLNYVGSNIFEDVSTPLSLTEGNPITISMAGWNTTTYNELYAPLTLAPKLFLLKMETSNSGQYPTIQHHFIQLFGMQNGNTNTPPDIAPVSVQTYAADLLTPSIKVRIRKPQGAGQAGTMGIEASLLVAGFSGGTMVYSLTQLI